MDALRSTVSCKSVKMAQNREWYRIIAQRRQIKTWKKTSKGTPIIFREMRISFDNLMRKKI